MKAGNFLQSSIERVKLQLGLKKNDFAMRAFEHAETFGLQGAMEFISQNSWQHFASDLGLLMQVQFSGSDADWLHNLNSWLARKGAAPVGLSSGEGERFSRLSPVEPVAAVEGPKVSVIMPAFNSARTIAQAANSILGQSWRNLELLIVDDCSTDATAEEIARIAQRDARVKALRNQRNSGPYVSKNRALQAASGAFITGHDADDWAFPDRIEKQMATIFAEPDRAGHIGQMVRLDASGKLAYPSLIGKFSYDGICRLASISLLMRKAVFENSLGYWDSVRFGADSELIARARKLLRDSLVTGREITMLCLDHQNSLTNHNTMGIDRRLGVHGVRKAYRDSWKAWHESLDQDSLFLPFPLTDRPFEAPAEMRAEVQTTDIGRSGQ